MAWTDTGLKTCVRPAVLTVKPLQAGQQWCVNKIFHPIKQGTFLDEAKQPKYGSKQSAILQQIYLNIAYIKYISTQAICTLTQGWF